MKQLYITCVLFSFNNKYAAKEYRMDLLEKSSQLTPNRLWIVDADNSQSRTLSATLTEQLSLSVKVTPHIPTSKIMNTYHATQLILINCHDMTPEKVEAYLAQINHYGSTFKVALYNLSALSNHYNLIQWPQVMAIFEEKSDIKQLIKGLNEVIQQGYWLPRHLISFMLSTQRSAPTKINSSIKLTKREHQILEYVSHGLTNAEIGQHIYISEHTVRSHLYNIYKKIGTKNRIQASAWAQQNLLMSALV